MAMTKTKGEKSLTRTILTAVAVIVALGAAITLFASQKLQRDAMIAIDEQTNKQASELIAMHIATAVNYKQLNPVKELLAKLGGEKDSPMAAAQIYGTDQNIVVSYQNDRLARFDFAASKQVEKHPAATTARVDGGFEVVSTPIVMGLDKRRIGTFVVAWDRSGIDSAIRSNMFSSIGIIAVVNLLILAALGYLLIRLVSKPVQSITSAMRELADGRNETEVPMLDRRDEMGNIARALQVFKDNAIAKQEMEARQDAENAQRSARAHEVQSLCGSFERAVASVIDRFSTSTTSLQQAARQLGEVAAQTTSQATIVADASRNAAANVDQVTHTVDAMSASTQDFSHQVETSQQISQQAVAEARNVNAKVETLSAAISQVDEVVRLISAIAGQTNLLALNATIEAARAGEAGKGFAIVASEVKNLAQQTEGATSQIGQQIAAMRRAMDDAVASVQSISEVIGRIDTVGATTGQLVVKQGEATQTIVQNVREAANGTSRVTASIEQVALLTGQTDQAAGLVLTSSREVFDQSEVLKREVEQFLKQVQAA